MKQNWTVLHCKTDQNCADVITRPIDCDSLRNCELFWRGPDFLYKNDVPKWKENAQFSFQLSDLERKPLSQVILPLRKHDLTNKISETLVFSEPTYSFSYVQYLRIAVFVGRFLKNCLQKNHSNSTLYKSLSSCRSSFGRPSARETAQIMPHIISNIQRAFFPEVFSDSKKRQSSALKNLGTNLHAFLDEKNMIRLQTRYELCAQPGITIQPFLLPKKHFLSSLYLKHTHIMNAHSSVHSTVALSRQEFWIVRGPLLMRSIIDKCRCRYISNKPFRIPQFPPLPETRTTYDTPFKSVGVDSSGPIKIYDGEKWVKVYLLIFGCLGTRNINIEIMRNATASELLRTFILHCSHTCIPSFVASDLALIFTVNGNFLQKWFLSAVQSDLMQNFLSDYKITWKTNSTGYVPFQTGHIESLLKIVKNCFYKTFGTHFFRKKIDLPEFECLISQIVATVNARPMLPIYGSSTLIISPIDLWRVGGALQILPDLPKNPPFQVQKGAETLMTEMASRISENSKILFKNFYKFYLNSLPTFQKPDFRQDKNAIQREPVVGEVIHIQQQYIHRLRWPIGIIIEVFRSPDGKIRSCLVKSAIVQKRSLQNCFLQYRETGNLNIFGNLEIQQTSKRIHVKFLYPLEIRASFSKIRFKLPNFIQNTTRNETEEPNQRHTQRERGSEQMTDDEGDKDQHQGVYFIQPAHKQQSFDKEKRRKKDEKKDKFPLPQIPRLSNVLIILLLLFSMFQKVQTKQSGIISEFLCNRKSNAKFRLAYAPICSQNGSVIYSKLKIDFSHHYFCFEKTECLPNHLIGKNGKCHRQLRYCECPTFSNNCIFEHFEQESNLSNFNSIADIISPPKSFVCLQPNSAFCSNRPTNISRNFIQLLDSSIAEVSELQITIQDFHFLCINTDFRPFWFRNKRLENGGGGDEFFCTQFSKLCNFPQNYFCWLANIRLPFFSEGEIVIPLKAYGSNSTKGFLNRQKRNVDVSSQCQNCEIQCATGGINFTSGVDVSYVKIEMGPFSTIFSEPNNTLFYPLPIEIILNKYKVKVLFRLKSSNTIKMSLECPPSPTCDWVNQVCQNKLFCKEKFIFRNCVGRTDIYLFLALIALFILCSLVALIYFYFLCKSCKICCKFCSIIPTCFKKPILVLLFFIKIPFIFLYHFIFFFCMKNKNKPYFELKEEDNRKNKRKKSMKRSRNSLIKAFKTIAILYGMMGTTEACTKTIQINSISDNCVRNQDNSQANLFCSISQIIRTTVLPRSGQICISLTNEKKVFFGIIKITIIRNALLCQKSTLNWLRSYKYETAAVKLCHWASNSCTSICNNEFHLKTIIPELGDIANRNHGHSYCRGVRGGLASPGSPCVSLKSACSMYKNYIIPTSPNIYSLVSCPAFTYISDITLEHFDTRNRLIFRKNFRLQLGKEIKFANITIGIAGFSTVPQPILNSKFLLQKKNYRGILVDPKMEDILLNSMHCPNANIDDQYSLCNSSIKNCECITGKFGLPNCNCRNLDLETIFLSNDNNILPVLTANSEIQLSEGEIIIEYVRGHAFEIQVGMADFRLRMFTNNATCTASVAKIKGTINSITGATAFFYCKSTVGETVASVICPSGASALVPCAPEGKQSEIRLHFARTQIAENCSVICPAATTWVLIEGELIELETLGFGQYSTVITQDTGTPGGSPFDFLPSLSFGFGNIFTSWFSLIPMILVVYIFACTPVGPSIIQCLSNVFKCRKYRKKQSRKMI